MKTLIFLISVFLKLKWYRAMKFYLLFVFLFALFFVSLCGFALAHYGNVYEEQPKLGHKVSNGMEWNGNTIRGLTYFIHLPFSKKVHYCLFCFINIGDSGDNDILIFLMFC